MEQFGKYVLLVIFAMIVLTLCSIVGRVAIDAIAFTIQEFT